LQTSGLSTSDRGAATAGSGATVPTNNPIGFWFFFWGEFAERCSYYGMRAILARYMAEQLGLGEADASTYMHYFIAACYFLPLVGGYVADNFFGKYWTIVGFSIPYILGHVILGVESFTFLVTALALLAMGSGVIKPNISTLMGMTYDQYRPGQTKLRSNAFAMFYFAINVGAAISQFAMPPLRTNYGYAIAFLFPAVLMAISFAIFAAGKKYYAIETISHAKLTDAEKAERFRVVSRVLGLFVLVMFFWAIFDQSASTWIFYANACMDLHMFGHKVDPDQVQAFNAVFILIFLPIITIAVNSLQSKGYRIRPTDKMVVGFLLTAACMGVMALTAWASGNADLRPASAKGHLSMWIQGENPEKIEGDLSVVVEDANGIVVTRTQVAEADSSKAAVKDAYTITAATGDLMLAKEGKKIVVEQEDPKSPLKITAKGGVEGKERTVANGPVRIEFEATKDDIKTTERWFVLSKNQTSIWWQVVAYLVLTIAEILISVTGLELGYTAAPKSMSGFVTACWLLTVGMANLFINSPVTRLYSTMQPLAYFGMLAVALLIVTVLFVFVAKRFNQSQEQAALPV
jgi:POT family proton-dependent oligopeptide transporter